MANFIIPGYYLDATATMSYFQSNRKVDLMQDDDQIKLVFGSFFELGARPKNADS